MTDNQDIFLIRHNNEFVLYAPIQGKAYLLNTAAALGLLSNTDHEGSIANIYSFLKEDGINFDSDVIETKNIDIEGDYKPTSVTLFPTSDCNLKCVYCFASAGEKKDSLNLDIAIRAIDEVLANAKSLGRKAKISFHGGGEPFSNFKLVKPLGLK